MKKSFLKERYKLIDIKKFNNYKLSKNIIIFINIISFF